MKKSLVLQSIDDDEGHSWESRGPLFGQSFSSTTSISLQQQDEAVTQQRRLRRITTAHQQGAVRRGLHRSVAICVDMSKAMTVKDFKPNRLVCAINAVEELAREISRESPVSEIAIVLCRNASADTLVSLSPGYTWHLKKLRETAISHGCSGDMSIGNAVSQSMIAPHSSRPLQLQRDHHCHRESLQL